MTNIRSAIYGSSPKTKAVFIALTAVLAILPQVILEYTPKIGLNLAQFLFIFLLPIMAVFAPLLWVAATKTKTVADEVILVALLVAGLIGGGMLMSYNSSSELATSIVDTSESRSGYEQRMSLPQAKRSLNRALEGTVGSISVPTYIDGEWCALLAMKQSLFRNEIVRVECVAEDGSARLADFNTPAPAAADGIIRTSAQIAASRATDGAFPDYEGVYAYIDENGDPFVVYPLLTKDFGFYKAVTVPAGVVRYDTNGKDEYFETVEAGEIPGPVFPISIAEDLREKINSRHGFMAHLQNKRTTLAVEGTEATGPNSSNNAEFTLKTEDGRLVYSTPMTPLGASDNTIGFIEFYADEVTRGELPEVRFHRLPKGESEVGPRAAQERIGTLYDADIDWQSSKLTEITPTAVGQYVTTVIAGQQSNYLITIEGQLTERNNVNEICVYRSSNTGNVGGDPIRCDDENASPAPTGSLRGLASSRTSTGATTGSRDLAQYSSEELLAELLRRENG